MSHVAAHGADRRADPERSGARAADGDDRPADRAGDDHARRRGPRPLARAGLLERPRRATTRRRSGASKPASRAPRPSCGGGWPRRSRCGACPSCASASTPRSPSAARRSGCCASSRTMSRRRPEAPGASGFLVVDKPRGWTSHDVVDAARRWLGTRRVGHLGTLDPLATGVLPLAVREATKLAPFLSAGAKTYTGEIELGAETDTLDAEGRVLRRHAGELPVGAGAARRAGGLRRRDPAGAADVQRGQARRRAAASARARGPGGGARAQEGPHRSARRCSPTRRRGRASRWSARTGTYVRSLAADLGATLGCGAFLASLRRTGSGPFRIEDAAAGGGARGGGARGPAGGEADPPRQRAGAARGPARGAGRAPRAQRQRGDARGRVAASRGAGRRAGPRAAS